MCRFVQSLEGFHVQRCISAHVLFVLAGLPRFVILFQLIGHQGWNLAHEGLALNRNLNRIILLIAVLVSQTLLEQRVTKNLLARKLNLPDLLLVRELNLRSVPRHVEMHAGDQVILILLPLFRAEYLLDSISSQLCIVEILCRDQIVEDV